MENLKNIKFAYFVSTVLFQLALVSSVQASSITSPLVSDSNTVGLWNFNLDPNDASNAVVDSGPNGINGTAYNAPLASSIPGLAGFGAARQFTTANGFVDFGVTKGSKLDLSGKTAAAIEAYIEPTAAMPGVSMIFDDGQIQLAVINNELAAFVAQSSGYKGVVASAPLTLNVPVRVGMSFADGVLGIFINEKNVGTVAISEPIAANPNANAHAFIGGNVLSQFFAGYIDDVRVSSSGRFDSVPPTITLATPAPGSLVTDAYPVFNFGLTDQGSGGIVSGIDPTSFQVYLNGVLESGLSVSVSGATGKLHDPLVFGQANEIKVIVSDLAGNTTTQSFFLNYSGNGGGTEYASDSHTLALWHMDEATPNYMPDSSPHAYHGYANGTVSVGQGVFGNGRVFRGTGSDFISIPLVAISNHKFTFETWMQPAYDHANDTQEQIIINTGQLKVSRFNTGNIRVVLNAIRETFVGETLSAAFPINELHHLEVTWDGSLANNNLIVSRDGILVQVFTVPGHCDFDNRPVTGVIGQNFSGMLDEMRISDSVRTIFNLVNKQEGVQFNSLQTGTSTNSKNPALNVVFNTQNLVDPTKVKVLLNGVQQPTGGSLVVTGSGISGSLPGDLIEGLNTVTVDFIDSNGNEVLKTANFYYINTLPLAPNAVDSNTLALWHFEDPQASAMIDSSGNGHDINTYPNDPNVQTVQGVFGLGRQFSATYSTANNLALGSRSFTIDGWMKILPSPSPSAYYSGPVLTYRSDAENLYITMPINAVTGDVELTFSSRDGSFDRTFQSLFPTDQQFHHLALIFDSSRSFSQILIAVDGVVKQTVDFTASCDFTQPGLLQISASTYAPTVFDEFRVSNTARYRYNISALPLPVIDSVSPLAETTVHNSSVSVSYVVHGTQGISTNDTYLSVNGVRQTGLTLSPSGVSATLSGVVSGLVSGANQFELHVADASGTATSQTMMVYLINQGPASAYTADVNTIALYHMDEMSGNVLADSSGNSYDLTLNGAWPLGAAGVFGTCAQMPSSYIYGQNSNFANVTGLGQSTVEGWFRLSNIDDSRPTILNLGNGNVLNLYVASGGIGAFWNSSLGQQDLRVTGVLPVDGKFHHAAVILDSAGAYRNMYLVLDGSVVLSRKVAPGGTTLVSGSGSVQIGGGSVTAFDEIRFSNVARYTLNYSKTKGIFQPISVGDRLGRVWIRLKAKVTKTVAEVLK